VLALAGCVLGAALPASAQAATDLSVSPELAGGTDQVAVGDTGQGQLEVTNRSDSGSLTLTELTLVPSCGADTADKSCGDAPGADAGVVVLGDSATGSGACAGITFAVALSDAASGKVALTPSAPVTLDTGGAATCDVAFTYTVGQMPTKDATEDDGVQTELVASAKATTGGSPAKTAADVGYDTVTVVRDTPQLSTQAAAAVAVGGALSASATLGGTHPEGTITFNLFGPADPICAGVPLSSSAVTATGNGTYTSPGVVAPAVGTYRWTASYAGDADNDPVTTACDAPGAAVDVHAAAPVLPANTKGTSGGSASGAGGPAVTLASVSGAGAAGARPSLSAFGLAPKSFTRGSSKGTTLAYVVSGPAIVRIVFERSTTGRRSGSKCVTSTAKLKHKAACVLYVKVRSLKETYKRAGGRHVRLSSRVSGHVLAAGTYRVRATAWAGSTAGTERKAILRIIKP
jgi:hypothetical protein